jgi:hypothetical protein
MYKRVELIEGEPVVFVGVHALRWRSEWGEPTVGFIDGECDECATLQAEVERLRPVLDASRNLVHDVRQVLCTLGAQRTVSIDRLKKLEEFADIAMDVNRAALTPQPDQEEE